MAEREPYPSEKQDRFIIRLPDGMRDRIKVAAETNNRSMNAEIVATLEEKYPAPASSLPTLTELKKLIREAETDERALEILADVNNLLNGLNTPFRVETIGPRNPDGTWNLEVVYL